MKHKDKSLTHSLLTYVIITLVFTGIGFLISFLLSTMMSTTFQDLTTYVGFILLFIGALSSLKGNPFAGNFRGMGHQNTNAITFEELEQTRQDRESTPYYKSFFKRSTVEIGYYRTSLIISGFLLLAGSYFLF